MNNDKLKNCAFLLGNEYYRFHFEKQEKQAKLRSDYGCMFAGNDELLKYFLNNDFILKDESNNPILVDGEYQYDTTKEADIEIIYNKEDLKKYFIVVYHLIKSKMLYFNENWSYNKDNSIVPRAIKKGLFPAIAIKRLEKENSVISEVKKARKAKKDGKDKSFKVYTFALDHIFKSGSKKNIKNMGYIDLINYSSIYGITNFINHILTVPQNEKEKLILNIEIDKEFIKYYDLGMPYVKSILLPLTKIKDSESNIENKKEIPFNILLKGVPGTGKSKMVDGLIEKLGAVGNQVLRINIHNGTSNSDLMQGIAVKSENQRIVYSEKQGAVLEHLLNAILHPNQNYVLVLEEIQENSLNKIIGDLIYLIETEKRTKIKAKAIFNHFKNAFELVQILNENGEIHPSNIIKIPSLIENEKPRSLIVPDNFYVFCTSNYRDDKKIIEDNLLRRFEVIELYPDETTIKNDNVRKFFISMNNSIESVMREFDAHPDRYTIGHASWMNEENICKPLLKMIIEFKDVKNIDFNTTKQILNKIETDIINFDLSIETLTGEKNISTFSNFVDYKQLIVALQKVVYGRIFKND